MKQIWLLFFLTAIHVVGFSQNMNDYSYVIVPDQFEFQTKVNQYQLNEMTKFYLEKNGFHAFFNSEAPNLDRCNGLYADVEYTRAWLLTRMEIVLRDCHKNEIYRSPTGKSKLKELDRSKQEALREAFSSFSTLKIRQKSLNLVDDAQAEQPDTKSLSTEQTETPVKNRQQSVGPVASFTTYHLENASYILRKTEEGYSLYKESETDGGDLELVGKITGGDTTLKFTDVSGKESDVKFDADGTLIIGKGADETIYPKSE